VKKRIKRSLVDIFNKFLSQPQIQNTLVSQHCNYGQDKATLVNNDSPYYEYSNSESKNGDGVVFITGRFRSGSTLLWNVFRQSDEFTSFYEPFNERQWFNSKMRGNRVDKTHRGVEDYWREYEDLESLGEFYDERWINQSLYMNSSAYEPNMRAFIDDVIQKSSARPVLQFNRMDFRLPWLKQQYPAAKFVHLYRHPRDQWCSFLTNKQVMNKDDVQDTYIDSFYLDVWCYDLYKHFPFLHPSVTPHPYNRFYYLWKLSYLFGTQYADTSISYEHLVENPVITGQELGTLIDANYSLGKIVESLIEVTSLGTWTNYADAEWFYEKEIICERTLTEFLNVT
jgi:hypothetical protein